MSTPRWLLSAPLIRFVFFVERWVFSALFLFLAWEHFDTLRLLRLVAQSRAVLPAAMLARDAGFMDGVHFEDFARYALLGGSNFACGLLLLIGKRPTRYPSRAEEVAVPLLATFGFALCNGRAAPAWMTTPFVPAAWAAPLAALGVVCSALGTVVSLGALLWLGRSLGIIVSVREVVLGGPYCYVRHPIYFGYFFVFAGLLLTGCSALVVLLAAGAFALLWWRARLEERLLADHSPAYREWMRRTSFFWPRLAGNVPARAGVRESEPERLPVLQT